MKEAYVRKYPLKLDDKDNFKQEYLNAWVDLLGMIKVLDENHDNQQYIKHLLAHGERYERPRGQKSLTAELDEYQLQNWTELLPEYIEKKKVFDEIIAPKVKKVRVSGEADGGITEGKLRCMSNKGQWEFWDEIE